MENTLSDLDPAQQNAVLEQAFAVQALLTKRILEGESTEGMVRALAEATGCCAVAENPRLEVIASGFSELAPGQELLNSIASVKASPAFMRLTNARRVQPQPFQLTDELSGLTVYRLVSAILAGSERLGFLSLIKTGTPFTAADAVSLEHAVGFFAMLLTQDKKIAEIELRLKGNFVEDLTGARYSDRDSILNRAHALDYDILLPHRVLVAEIDNLNQIVSNFKQDQKAITLFKTELVQKIQSLLDLSVKGMVMYKNDEIIMLVQQGTADGSISTVKQLAEEIIKEIQPIFKVKLYIGIGHTCRELADYQQSYSAAKKALEIGAFMITEGQVRSFEQFKIHALFLSTLKPAELYNYARAQLGALLEYDEKHKTELLKTLQEFLYLRNSIEGTARSLSMSVSGLKYRLQKIEHIIGQELSDYKVSFDLQLALIILQLFGEYRIRN